MTKNILFYLTRYPAVSGGIERVTTSLANELSSEGYKVVILSVYQQDSSSGDYLLPVKSVKVLRLPDEMDKLLSNRNISFFNSVIENEDIDTIVYQDSYANSHTLLKQVSRKVRLVVVEHTMPTCSLAAIKSEFRYKEISNFRDVVRKVMFPLLYVKNKRRIQKRHAELYAMADKYVVLASEYINQIKELIGKNDVERKLTFINNPITTELNLKIDYDNKKDILFVGRLEAQKGIGFLLEIWKRFCKVRPGWHLRIVGDGPLRADIEKRIKNESLQNVILEGNVVNTVPVYRGGVILCMTSVYEGWPLVLAESFANGVVPLAFGSFGAINDIIDDGVNGYIISPFNLEEYVDKMCNLVDNNDMRQRMAEKGIEKARNFAMTNIIKKWIDII